MSDDCASSFARIVENVPIIGHLVSMCHACAKKPAHAERAGLKATLGLLFCLCNCPAEAVDEGVRRISPKLFSISLTSRPEWMKKYLGHTLRQVCLPGSHQSATYHLAKKLSSLPMASGWAKCQELSLESQLKGGIRFLDIRVMSDEHGEIWTHHNVITCLSLKDILEIVRCFVRDHSTEIVGMYITNDGKSVDWSTCNGIINEYVGNLLIQEHQRDMLISDIVDQGKNVFIGGIPNVAYSWKNIQPHWPNKEWPDELHEDLENTLAEFYENGPQNYFWYKAECTPGSHMILRAVGGVPGAAAHKCSDEKFEFVEDMAAAANHTIYDILTQIETIPFNIMSIDYVQDEIVDRIIELNAQGDVHDETIMLTASTENILESTQQSQKLLGIHASGNAYHYGSTGRDQSMSVRSADTSGWSDSLQAHSLALRSPGQHIVTPMRTSANSSMRSSVNSSIRSQKIMARREARAAKGENMSVRYSNVSTRVDKSSYNNITATSLGPLEMPLTTKAPPLEVKETTM